jgi:hypothetical protein
MAEQQLTGRLLAVGRALAGISHADLATASGTPLETVQFLEANGAAFIFRAGTPQPCSPRLKPSASSSSAKATEWAQESG